MPTRLGNILRAAETRPGNKYGLNAIICWPRLWLVLPEDVRTELNAARTRLDTGTLAGFWSLLFVVWVRWAPLLGLLAAFIAYRGMLGAVGAYLIESAFDVHRTALM